MGAGGSPFGIGTDIGGSIRNPAFANGVFGHKPSGGLVPGSGQHPAYSGSLLRKNVTGPLAPGSGPSAALRAAQQDAAYALARRGMRVAAHRVPALRRGAELWVAALHEDGGPPLARLLDRPSAPALLSELARSALGRSDHMAGVLAFAVAQCLLPLAGGWVSRHADEARALRAELDALLGDDGVLLYPSARGTAPRGDAPWRELARFPFTPVFNALELPVTQVPTGLSRRGLPVGVQGVAAHGRDHVAIATARVLEQELGVGRPRPEAGAQP